GGAAGLLFGILILHYFPNSGLTLPLSALIGMSALFAGASRALLTSIIFAIESTGQSNALLPLLAACSAAYFISFFFMENTIMTEKIARKGVKIPDSYEPDVLDKILVSQVTKQNPMVMGAKDKINAVKELVLNDSQHLNYFMVKNENGDYLGYLSIRDLFGSHDDSEALDSLLTGKSEVFIKNSDTLYTAVKMMLKKDKEGLPVQAEDGRFVGLLTYKDILSAYRINQGEFIKAAPEISLKRRGLRILARGNRFFNDRKDAPKHNS
ncbi:MAG TPA: chloride channel protein, partial [Arachidicoccus sp.]|nr:chloride channel protein [Arachidicoccus sp.]